MIHLSISEELSARRTGKTKPTNRKTNKFKKMGQFDKRLLELSARDSKDNIPIATAVLIIITLGVIGNAVAFMFYGFKERKTITNFLIAVLAFNDLIVNLVFYDEMFFHFEPFKFTNTAGCKLLWVINNWVLLNSVSLMLVIAIERYRKICHPFSWQFTQFRARVTTISVTITTLVLCSREAFFAEIVPEHIIMNDNSTVIGFICSQSHDKKLKPFIKGSNFVTMTLYLSLFASIITAYSLIIRRIYQVNKATSTTSNTKNGNHEVIEMNETTNSSSNATVTTGDSNTNNSHQDNKEYKISPNENNDNSNTNTQTPHTATTLIASESEMEPTSSTPMNENTVNTRVDSTDDTSDVEGTTHKQAMIVKQKHNPPNKLAEVEKRITKMIIIVAVASILSFVPYFLVILLVPSHNSTEDQLSNMKKKVFRESYKLNGVINPYIMCIFSSNFRQFIKSIFCRCFYRK